MNPKRLPPDWEPTPEMPTVVVESPYGGEQRERHEDYLDACLLDCYERGEAPFASHAIGPRCLDDDTPHERKLGIMAGFAVGRKLDKRAVYTDLGITVGMAKGVRDAEKIGQPIEERSLPGWKRDE